MILWHNPRCSKSRQTVAMLQEHGVEPTLRLYLTAPPTREEIVQLRDELGVTTLAMMRKGDTKFKELGLAGADEEALLAAMVAHPVLIERPIAINENGARIGRPPELILELL